MSTKQCSVLYADHLIGWMPGPGVRYSKKLEWQLEMLSIFIRNGFEQVYIPFVGEPSSDFQEDIDWLYDRVSSSFEKQIIPVNIISEWQSVASLLKPFRENFRQSFSMEELRTEYLRLNRTPKDSNFYPEYFDNWLSNFLVNILVANRLKAHVVEHKNFSPKGARSDLELIRSNLNRREITDNNFQYLLDRIEGLICNYKDDSLVKFSSKRSLTVSEIREILLLPEYKSATSELKRAGLLGEGIIRLHKVNFLLQSIAKSKLTQNLLYAGKAVASVFAVGVTPGISLVESVFKLFRTESKPEFIPLYLDVDDFERENRIDMTG